MAYTAPNDLFASEEAILSLASSIADEDRTALGNGTINGALDVLADALAERNVEVPPMNAGAILALAQYVSGGGGGGSSDLTTAHVTVMAGTVSETFETDAFNVCTFLETEGTATSVTAPIISDEPVESLEFDALLYKGAAALSTYLPVASTSGGITDHGDGHFFVTGDCTITLS